ncbi:MFS transporter [Porticoccaceae bacterium LTM1]|nr:MFS transporter [Porticoccaceae bacterium LTM1]
MSNDSRRENHSTNVSDVKQLGTFAAIASLSYVFWVVGGMELVERLAYYGVRASHSLYAKAPVSEGGLGITMTEFGTILLWWGVLQSLLIPPLIGGIADRIGYKQAIFASTVFKISGYLVMAFFPTFGGYFCGAMLLAAGTGVFKPGITGTLVKSTNRTNSSVAWGIFYQMVNWGGFFGPLIAVQLRQLSWDNLFFTCAAIISINFLLLCIYKEPGKEERLALKARVKAGEVKQDNLAIASLKALSDPKLFLYLLLFSGFWFMFMPFFDVLPAFIQEWVDTSIIVTQLFGDQGTQNAFAKFILGMDNSGTYIKPEGLLNLNAGMIMLTCFLVAGFSARMKALNSIVLGTCLASAAMLILGSFHWAWMIVIAIVVFSTGEMLSSPKFSEYLGNIAPNDKKAMYLGFSQIPVGVGMSVSGKIAPMLYDKFASKDLIAREMIGGLGADNSLEAIPQGEAFSHLVTMTGQTASELTLQLYQANNIGMLWYILGLVGILSAFGISMYARWIWRLAKSEETTASGVKQTAS